MYQQNTQKRVLSEVIMTGVEMIEKLKDYSEFHGVEIKASEFGGTGVFATEPLAKDDIVVKIPKESVLSPRTTQLAPILQQYDDLEPVNALITAYLFEKALDENSKWYEFISQINDAQLPDIPGLWSSEEKRLLKGTNIGLWVSLDTDEIEQGYADAKKVLKKLKSLTGHKVDFPEWRNAALIVSSRSFDVDNYHDLSLVPGACLFNHSDRESLHFETDGNVCGKCGSLSCECEDSWEDDDDMKEEEEEEEVEDFNSEEEDDDEESDEQVESSEEGEFVDEENAYEAGQKKGKEEVREVGVNICEMRLLRDVALGEEIFNTYGNDPNGVLLSRYGFAIWNNTHDIVDFEREVEKLAKEAKLSKKVKVWRSKQEKQLETESNDEESEELLFVGLINGIDDVRYSLGLISLAKALKLEVDNFAHQLSRARYQKYLVRENSSEIKQKLTQEKSSRLKMALIAVGTEKLLLESVLSKH